MRTEASITRRGMVAALAAVLLAAAAVVAMGARASAAQACKVDYSESAIWNTGFVPRVILTNLGDPWTSWELRFAYGGNERLVNGYGDNWSQDGHNIIVRNASWNGNVPTGKSVQLGATFTYTGSHVVPTQFTVNGVLCNFPLPTGPTGPAPVGP